MISNFNSNNNADSYLNLLYSKSNRMDKKYLNIKRAGKKNGEIKGTKIKHEKKMV